MVILLPIPILIAGALISPFIRDRRACNFLANLTMAVSCILIVLSSLKGEGSISLPLGLDLGMDPLSAVFCTVLGIVGLSVSIYSTKYMERYEDLRLYGIACNTLILSMYLVLIVRNAFWFLFSWELMTLSSFALVIYEHEREEVRKAGFKYFVMTHIGVACIIAAVLLLYHQTFILGAPGMSFSSLYTASRSMPWGTLQLCYLLLLTGFLVKAGAVPLHSWLPDAYPAAPTNISALLSGFVTKTAVYAIIRFFLTVLPLELWCGIALAIVGLMSMFFGGIYAIRQVDTKRLLAYSSVENMGYITLALGSAICFLCLGQSLIGSIALLAGILHTVNHAFFKSLLFMSAGSVLYRTGKRDMDLLGGLGAHMPITSALALVGSLSASGVPLFNGFVSKWLIYAVTATSFSLPLLPVCAAVAIMISAVTGAFLLKFWSSIFTGPPREEVAECPYPMIVGELIPASLCLLIGVYPASALLPISRVSVMLGIPSSAVEGQLLTGPFLLLLGPKMISTISLTAVFSFLVLLLAVTTAVLRPSGTKSEPWWCGMRPRRFWFQSSSYYRNLEEMMSQAYISPRMIRLKPYPEPDTDRILVKPFVRAFRWISERILLIATGKAQFYLAVMFLTLLIMLGVMVWMS